MQVQQEALTEEAVALLQSAVPVQLCLQPQSNPVLSKPEHDLVAVKVKHAHQASAASYALCVYALCLHLCI